MILRALPAISFNGIGKLYMTTTLSNVKNIITRKHNTNYPITGKKLSTVLTDEYWSFPNITNSPHDSTVLFEFLDIFKKITNDVKLCYDDNNLIPPSQKPKKIHYYVCMDNKEDKVSYKGTITFFNNDGASLKRLPLEQIVTNNGFTVIPLTQDSGYVNQMCFLVQYNVDNNPILKDTIIESLLVNGDIIRNISHKVTI